MKILHVIARMDPPGGAERMVMQLVEDAIAHGDHVAVASAGGAWVSSLESAGATHHMVPLDRRSTASTIAGSFQLRKVLGSFRPDVVHAHNVRAATACRVAAVHPGARAGTSIIATLHGVAPSDYRSAARLLRLSCRRVIACAPAVARSLRQSGFPPGKLEVVTNGAAMEPAPVERQEALKDLLCLDQRPLVVGVGRLVAQKDWPVLIEAAQDIEPAAQLVVAGDGPMREALEALASEAGGRVRFLGIVDDMSALLTAADCLVSTSAWEGLPLSLLEALSMGVPCAATAVGGVRDVVPPEAALLVPPGPGSAGAVARAVNTLLSDRELATRLGDSARAAAKAWSPEAMLAGYRLVYREAAEAVGAGGSSGLR